jgi:type I restriction enzyme S subunit
MAAKDPTAVSKAPPAKGWMWVRFGGVVREVNVVERNPLLAGLTRFVGMEHLERGDLRVRSWGNVADGVTFTRVFRAGQVLFGKRRVYQRKAAVPDFDGVCSADILVLEPKTWPVGGVGMIPELLPYIVQTDGFYEKAVGTSAGSLSPRTKFKDLAKYEFTLPADPAEQRRIVDTLTSATDSFERWTEALRQARDLRRALVLELYSFKSVRESGIHKCALREKYEIQPGKKFDPDVCSGEPHIPYMRNANVQWSRLDLCDVKSTFFSPEEIIKFTLKPGDILLCEGRHVGKSVIWNDEIPGACYQNTLHRLRPLDREQVPEFLLHYMRYCSWTGLFRQHTGETTIPHLTASQLSRVLLFFPDRKSQSKIVGLVSELDEKISLIEKRRAVTCSLKSRLINSLLDRTT